MPDNHGGGLGGGNTSQYWLRDDGVNRILPAQQNKPPYCVPSMDDIRALPWNGFTVASTFSGGGGSSTGYRMAGFKVLYANEFVEAARATYAANMAEHTHLDGRDIRDVTPESVLQRMGLKAGELDILDGSPPCSAFSTAGKREAGWGKAKSYSDNKTQVVDDLFYEYARLVDGIKPKVFIAENVSGLIKGTAKGYFLNILARLKKCGYRVEAKLLDAQWLGVPQARQRLIFVGVRDDLGFAPSFPKPFAYRYSVREALPWIIRQADNGPFGGGAMREATMPSPTIGAGPQTGNGKFPASLVESKSGIDSKIEQRKFTIPELRQICGFPNDYILKGTYSQQWERCGRSVPPLMMKAIAGAVRDKILIPAREAGKI